jgi:hypothetical protein
MAGIIGLDIFRKSGILQNINLNKGYTMKSSKSFGLTTITIDKNISSTILTVKHEKSSLGDMKTVISNVDKLTKPGYFRHIYNNSKKLIEYCSLDHMYVLKMDITGMEPKI